MTPQNFLERPGHFTCHPRIFWNAWDISHGTSEFSGMPGTFHMAPQNFLERPGDFTWPLRILWNGWDISHGPSEFSGPCRDMSQGASKISGRCSPNANRVDVREIHFAGMPVEPSARKWTRPRSNVARHASGSWATSVSLRGFAAFMAGVGFVGKREQVRVKGWFYSAESFFAFRNNYRSRSQLGCGYPPPQLCPNPEPAPVFRSIG